MIETETETRKLPYSPRWYQEEFESAMFGGKRRAFLLYHRRSGKDFACWCFMVNCALGSKAALYYYILPTYAQGKKVIWDGIDESGRRLLDYIPKECIEGKPNATEMKIRLENGSIIQIVGSDRYDSLRGTNPYGIVFSEYAMQTPKVWDEVISPILLKNDGWAVFNTTPMGKNAAYELWCMAQQSSDWYTKKLTIEDTGLISKEQLERERAEGKPSDILEQEYMCSFDIGIRGAYYGKEVSRAEQEGRVSSVNTDPNLLVYTSWDLGYSDAMSIVFFQVRANNILIIDHYENHGFALSHYLQMLRDRGYSYGKHFIPHDGANHSAISGENYVSAAKKLGFDLTVIPTNQTDIEVGINKVRGLFPRFLFDKEKTYYLLKCLLQYHSEWDDKAQVFRRRPKHDWSSHCFTGDTIVITGRGMYRIMDLPESGQVMTLQGWSEYKSPRITRKNAKIVAVKFKSGLVARCTPDHLFLSGNGWIKAQDLTKGIRILSSLGKTNAHNDIATLDITQPVIESVEEITDPEDVWCLTVPDVEHFSLANGAIVHNCADAMRVLAFALNDIEAGEGGMSLDAIKSLRAKRRHFV